MSRVEELSLLAENVGETVLIRGRVHRVRVKGKAGFIVLRKGMETLQACIFAKDPDDSISKEVLQQLKGLTLETVIELIGVVNKTPRPVLTCSVKDVEIAIREVKVLSPATPQLPLLVEDASRSDKEIERLIEQAKKKGKDEATVVVVTKPTRLDNRVIDLRTPANQAIFRIQSGVCRFFREYLIGEGFTEIHSPKIIGGASEGGCDVFKLDYFGSEACLAQSPQLYKQAAICADMKRVFEIGPVFRAEHSHTHRHLCEFTGLDFEMEIEEDYHEILTLYHNLFLHIFKGLNTVFAKELKAVDEQYPFEPFVFTEKPVIISFPEGVKMLREAGYEQADEEDLAAEQEKALGRLVKEKFGTDFYMLDKFPMAVRPFYTMPDPENPKYSNSYDIFMRGQEITSGAQRIHVQKLLAECALKKGVTPESLGAYFDNFAYGCPPHGGAGIGLERVVMLFLDLPNCQMTSFFCRTPTRLAP
ncbi:Aspartate--tRNA ligase, cytoplasmic [Aduncisulcus paluster]|uniref:aspartate--tRNA ligase n=1 Tax=Aduncisulcus paluster TaxID=2918883 RepID=A0ABQ5KQ09_9EUKA|nr:Aspartate--tRNA ligase, cytoplasmic [Aduncisulcus paluster]